jgi:hypothetical protein
MRQQVPLWQWIVIVVGVIIALVYLGRWVHNQLVTSKAPPPPASPEEATKEYYGYPVKPPPARK